MDEEWKSSGNCLEEVWELSESRMIIRSYSLTSMFLRAGGSHDVITWVPWAPEGSPEGLNGPQ